jgi:hypothetical protein
MQPKLYALCVILIDSVALYVFPCDFSQWFTSNANDLQFVYPKPNDSQLQMRG